MNGMFDAFVAWIAREHPGTSIQESPVRSAYFAGFCDGRVAAQQAHEAAAQEPGIGGRLDMSRAGPFKINDGE